LKPRDLQARYKTLIGAHHEELVRRMVASGTDYVRVDTDQPLDRSLHAYLDRRLARSRVR
jgi:hypothetical protein